MNTMEWQCSGLYQPKNVFQIYFNQTFLGNMPDVLLIHNYSELTYKEFSPDPIHKSFYKGDTPKILYNCSLQNENLQQIDLHYTGLLLAFTFSIGLYLSELINVNYFTSFDNSCCHSDNTQVKYLEHLIFNFLPSCQLYFILCSNN